SARAYHLRLAPHGRAGRMDLPARALHPPGPPALRHAHPACEGPQRLGRMEPARADARYRSARAVVHGQVGAGPRGPVAALLAAAMAGLPPAPQGSRGAGTARGTTGGGVSPPARGYFR